VEPVPTQAAADPPTGQRYIFILLGGAGVKTSLSGVEAFGRGGQPPPKPLPCRRHLARRPFTHDPVFLKNMYPFNFLAAVMTLGVSIFYIGVNWMHTSRGGKRYHGYRNAFCVAVVFLSVIQIVRAFSPLELQNNLLQMGVATVLVILILWIKIFEILAEHKPGVAARALFVVLILVALGAMFLPGGGYWGAATFTQEKLYNGDIFLRPQYGPPTPYRSVLIAGGLFGLGYLLWLASHTSRQRDRKIGRAMAIATICMVLVMTWNVLCGMKVINGSVAPGLYGISGIIFFMWIDRENEDSLLRENKLLGEHNLAQTAMLDALVRHGAFACAEFNAEGTLLTQNPVYQERIAPLLNATGFKSYDRTRAPVQTSEKFWHGLTMALDGSIQAKTLSWTASDGETITYKARFIPFKPSVTESNHAMVCLTDITEALDSRQQLLEAKHLQAIGLLASGVAHEYNNILTGVIAMSELALREAVNDTQRSHLEIVVQAAKRCTDLSGNLLSLSRNNPTQNEPLDLREIIHETMRLVRHSRGVQIELLESVQSSAHIAVVGNRNELATLLLNLMINACDAMDNRGTITLRIDYAEVTKPAVSLEPTPHVVLQLSDTGPGIPEEIIPHIFEPFFTTKRLGKGSGLGLATAKAIATAHGGNIEAKFVPAGGAVFEITLPMFAGLPTLSPSPFPIPPPAAKQSGQAAVIDDDPIVLATSANILHDLGYQVAAYSSAEKFLESYTPAAQAAIKLAVIDIRMPGMDGVQLCRRLLTMSTTLKIILVTGHTEKYDTAKLSQLHNVSILMKPFSLTALQNLIIEIETQAALKSDDPMI
jgi:signal transduction histidine kinase/CheY-like chemotaxis protein